MTGGRRAACRGAVTPRGTDWGLALLLALGLVLAVLVSGTVWSSAGRVGVAGYAVLSGTAC